MDTNLYNFKKVPDKTFNTLLWSDFIKDLAHANSSKPKEVLRVIISTELFLMLRDESIFVHNLKEYLIKKVHEIYDAPILTGKVYLIVREIKNCHFFVKEEVEKLINVLPDSFLSKVE